MENKKYKLYATKKIPENFFKKNATIYTLIPSHGLYLLAYTDKILDEAFKEVPEVTPLSDEESTWLLNCKMEIASKAMSINSEQYIEVLRMFTENFKKELQKEARKHKRAQQKNK